MAVLLSGAIAASVTAILVLIGWRWREAELWQGALAGLVLGLLGAALMLRGSRRRPSPARYAVMGGFMGLLNTAFAIGAVLVAGAADLADAAVSRAVGLGVLVSGGLLIAAALPDPQRVLVVAVASTLSGVVAGLTFGLLARRA